MAKKSGKVAFLIKMEVIGLENTKPKKYNRIFEEKQEEIASKTVSAVTRDDTPFNEQYKGVWRASKKVNFRAHASKTAPVIEILNIGTTVKCDGYFEKDGTTVWLKVTKGNRDGFIMAEFLSRR